MSIRYYSMANICPMSKPRGQIGKSGNMTHSSGNYREFQESVTQRLCQLNFKLPSEFFSLGYIFYMAKKRGRANDVGNMVGAIEDVLVKAKFIQDDSWLYLPRSWQEAIPCSKFSIVLLVFEKPSDLVYFISARDRLLEQFRAS